MLVITVIFWYMSINHRWNYIRDFFKRNIGNSIAAHDTKLKLGIGFMFYLVISTVVWKVICTVSGYVPLLGSVLSIFCMISGLG